MTLFSGSLRTVVLALLIALPQLAACSRTPSPAQHRVKAGEALFEDRCKNVAGIKIYKTVADVEGIVLLKVRPKAGEREWSDPMWPGAAFAKERQTDEYISSFLGYEHSGTPGQPVSAGDRGYVNTDYLPGNPSNLPGYRYVDVMEEGAGARWRYSLAKKPRPTSKIGWIDTVLERVPAPVEGPRYGVMYEDHVIPEERALGLASSTVKVLDLKTNEVLGEFTRYAWTPAKPNPANPSPWLSAYSCGDSFTSAASTKTRLFVDQILLPRKDK